MLLALLWQFSKPYSSALLAVVSLQLISTLAALYLPTLNADIIDKGVAVGNTDYILAYGRLDAAGQPGADRSDSSCSVL